MRTIGKGLTALALMGALGCTTEQHPDIVEQGSMMKTVVPSSVVHVGNGHSSNPAYLFTFEDGCVYRDFNFNGDMMLEAAGIYEAEEKGWPVSVRYSKRSTINGCIVPEEVTILRE